MGEESTDKRSTDTLAMLDYGFNMYNIDIVVDKNNSLGKVKVDLGETEEVDIKTVDDITILNDTQKGKRNITYEIETKNILAPVKVGDIVGKILVYEDGNYKFSTDITVDSDINKASILKIFLRNIRDVFSVNI